MFQVTVTLPSGRVTDLASEPVMLNGERAVAGEECSFMGLNQLPVDAFQRNDTAERRSTVLATTLSESSQGPTAPKLVPDPTVTMQERITLKVFMGVNDTTAVVGFDTQTQLPVIPRSVCKTLGLQVVDTETVQLTGIEGGTVASSAGIRDLRLNTGSFGTVVPVVHVVDLTHVTTPLLPLLYLAKLGLTIPRSDKVDTLEIGGQRYTRGTEEVFFPTYIQYTPDSINDVEGGPADDGFQNLSALFRDNTVLVAYRPDGKVEAFTQDLVRSTKLRDVGTLTPQQQLTQLEEVYRERIGKPLRPPILAELKAKPELMPKMMRMADLLVQLGRLMEDDELPQMTHADGSLVMVDIELKPHVNESTYRKIARARNHGPKGLDALKTN
jgi:hypothetical protein